MVHNYFRTIMATMLLMILVLLTAYAAQRPQVRDTPQHPVVVPNPNERLVLPVPPASEGAAYTLQICGMVQGSPMCSPIMKTAVTGTDPALFSAPMPGSIAVPDLVGLPLWRAQGMLRELHLRPVMPFCNFSNAQAAGTVDLQSLPPGSKVAAGTEVRVWVSAGRLYR